MGHTPYGGFKIPKGLIEESGLDTQSEMLAIPMEHKKYTIGIPKEYLLQENRVPLVPHSIATLVGRGHHVIVEADAGSKSRFSDKDFSEAGAEIAYSKEKVFASDIIIKIAPPDKKEIKLLKPNQVLISPIHLPLMDAEYINLLRHKRVLSLAMEYIHDDRHIFPIVRSMSEIAGISSILTAAELLTSTRGGAGVLLGGIAGVPPAKVIILGAGVVAEFAARTALGLGAEVRVFDNSIHKLRRLQNNVGQQFYTSVIDPFNLKAELLNADVAIGAIHSPSGRSPMIVDEETIMNMKPGSVIVDVSIDQGGCFETSKVTMHQHPTMVVHDVIHYCVPNIPSKVARTASMSISNILTTMLLNAADQGGFETALYRDKGLQNGVYTYKGCLTNEYLGQLFDIKSTDLQLLFTSNY